MFSWLDAPLAALGDGFMRAWSKVERSYRRPFSRIAFRLKFAYYPLLAIAGARPGSPGTGRTIAR